MSEDPNMQPCSLSVNIIDVFPGHNHTVRNEGIVDYFVCLGLLVKVLLLESSIITTCA